MDWFQQDSENMLISALAALMLLVADPVTYMGRQVTVVDPGTEDPDGFYPKGEAKVCVQGQAQKDCYTAPKGVGRIPRLSVIELRKVSTPDENSPFRRSKNPHPKRLPACAGSDVPLCPLSLILGSAARTARS
ncbi:MAG TPA: hypothetical protein VMT15_06695, partial [Bryobacteraceae bacterium]|nr:hypothetical protein [Bryobacteraceae bacterium]